MKNTIIFSLLCLLCINSQKINTTIPDIELEGIIRPSEQLRCMAYVIHKEAGETSLNARRAVYDVVRFRAKTRKLSVCQVLKQKHQFSVYKPGQKLKISTKWLTDTKYISMMKPVVADSEYFHAKWAKPAWTKKMQRIGDVGGNVFYRSKGKK